MIFYIKEKKDWQNLGFAEPCRFCEHEIGVNRGFIGRLAKSPSQR